MYKPTDAKEPSIHISGYIESLKHINLLFPMI